MSASEPLISSVNRFHDLADQNEQKQFCNELVTFINVLENNKHGRFNTIEEYQSILRNYETNRRAFENISLDLDSTQNEQQELCIAIKGGIEIMFENIQFEMIRYLISLYEGNQERALILFLFSTERDLLAMERKRPQILKLFHPDKINRRAYARLYEPMTRIFQIINNYNAENQAFLDTLGIQLIPTNEEIENYRREAELLYKTAMEGRSFLKEKTRKPLTTDDVNRILRSHDAAAFRNATVEDLKSFVSHYFREASKRYHAAIYDTDRMRKNDCSYNVVNNQIQLRYSNALCLYLGEFHAEAQLYLFGGLFLTLQIDDATRRMDWYEKLSSALQKFRGVDPVNGDHPVNSSAIVVTSNGAVRVGENVFSANFPNVRQMMEQRLSHDVIEWSLDCLIRGNLQLVSTTPTQRVDIQAHVSHLSGYGVVVSSLAGVVVAGVFLGIAITDIVAIVGGTTAAGAIGGPIGAAIGCGVGVIVSVVCLIFGFTILCRTYAGYEEESERPRRTMKLNEMITNAIAEANKGNHEEVLQILSQAYGENSNHRLFAYSRNQLFAVNADEIIDQLLDHGFRADGVAFILNLIAEALIKGKVDNKLATKKTLLVQASNFLVQIYTSEKLINNANRLDRTLNDVRRTNVNYLRKLISRFRAHYIDGIPPSYFEDLEEAPFLARLQEMQNICRLNRAIIHVSFLSADDLNQAKTEMSIVRVSVNTNYQYFTIDQVRLAAMDDFISILNLLPVA